MTPREITALRLQNQLLFHSSCKTPGEVVRRLAAMQAQDYPGALWSVALRLPDATKVDIEEAIARKELVRTWPMRGTLHFVAPEDIRWMLKLLTPKVVSSAVARRRELELDDEVFNKSREVLTKALQGGKILTRSEMCDVLEANGIKTPSQRGIHILWTLSQQGVLCYGPHRAKEPTFVLLDEWLPKYPEPSKEEALANLAERYFASHGPATLEDFAGWTKLTITEARAALHAVSYKLVSESVDDKTYWFSQPTKDVPVAGESTLLLPGFDEYMLGYKDRSAALEFEHQQKIVPGNNGMFQATIVVDGQVVGLWRRTITAKAVKIQLEPFAELSSKNVQALETVAEKYGHFWGLPVAVAVNQ